jgi:glycine dehydrogenase subunit 2
MKETTVGASGLVFNEEVIFDLGGACEEGYSLPEWQEGEADGASLLPAHLVRGEIEELPQVSEFEVLRHFTRLSQWNFSIDGGFYPLGSCTMKYNPRVNEAAAALPEFATLHPYQGADLSQGALQVMWELQNYLGEISGLPAVTLQPAAGAHGEMTGMLMIRAWHADRGRPRSRVLIPDSAHGTNPASIVFCGWDVEVIKSDERGLIDPAAVAKAMDEDVAAVMLTNPNTLGLFEDHVREVSDIVHAGGGLVYMDGANLNAMMGITRPAEMGVDVMHFNLHKTFATPHGGGGPGAGPVAATADLAPYLPVPRIVERSGKYLFDSVTRKSIGRTRAFYGNFAVLLRAWSYIRSMGPEGLLEASRTAVVNANYVRLKLHGAYHVPYDRVCMHECVLSDREQRGGASTLDIAKRLIDYGFHPPTVYFPLIVKGALMIEPTETESRETLDRFIGAMLAIDREIREEPEVVKAAPSRSKVSRLNEVKAAREPDLRWRRAADGPGDG